MYYFLFRFRLYAFIEAAALCSIVFMLRYACALAATRYAVTETSLFLIFLYHCRFLFVWRVRCTFFSPSGWWCFSYLATTGWIFYMSLLCENSISQSINAYDPIATRSYLASNCCLCPRLFLFIWRSLFPVPLQFYLCMESTSYVFSFRMVFSNF